MSRIGERKALIQQLLRLRQSIDAAWSVGLADKVAAETLDALVDEYVEITEALLADDEPSTNMIRGSVKRVTVLAMKVWDGIASEKREQVRRNVHREDLPADLTNAVRLFNDAETKIREAIDFSKVEDVSGLQLYEAAVKLYDTASGEVLLIEKGTRGLRRERRGDIRLRRWQLILAISSILVTLILSILAFVLRK